MELEKLNVGVRYGGQWKFKDIRWEWTFDYLYSDFLLVDRTILFEQLRDKICQITGIDRYANDIMIYRRRDDEPVLICNESHWAAIKSDLQECNGFALYMTCTPRKPEKLSTRTKGMELEKLGVCVRYGGEWKFTDFNWVWVGDRACTNFLLVDKKILFEQLLDKICQTTCIDRYANDIVIYRRCDDESVPICNESHWAAIKYVFQKRHEIDLYMACTPRRPEKLSIRTKGTKLEKLGVCVRYGGEWKFTDINWVWVGDLACTDFLLVDRTILFEQLPDKICQTTGIDRYANDIMIYHRCDDETVPICNESHWAAIKYVFQKRHQIDLYMTCTPRKPEKLPIRTEGIQLEKLGVCVRYGGEWKFTDFNWVWVGDLACTNVLLVDRTILFEQLLDKICQTTRIDQCANDIMIYRRCEDESVPICNESHWAAIKYVFQKCHEIDLYMTCTPRRPEKLSIRTKGMELKKLGVCVRYGGEWKFTDFNWVWVGDLACTNFLLVYRTILLEQLLDKICQTTAIDRYANDIMIYRRCDLETVPICNESHWATMKYVYQKCHVIDLYVTCTPRKPEKLSIRTEGMELEKLGVCVRYGGEWKFTGFNWVWIGDLACTNFLLVDRKILFEQLLDKICQTTGIDRYSNDIMIYRKCDDDPVPLCNESHWAAIKYVYQKRHHIELCMTCNPRRPKKLSIQTKGMELEKLGVCVRYGGDWKFTDSEWVWVGDLACTNFLLADRTILFEQLLDTICQSTGIDRYANDIMIYRMYNSQPVTICNESDWAAIKHVYQKIDEIDLYMTCIPRRPEKLSIRTKGRQVEAQANF